MDVLYHRNRDSFSAFDGGRLSTPLKGSERQDLLDFQRGHPCISAQNCSAHVPNCTGACVDEYVLRVNQSFRDDMATLKSSSSESLSSFLNHHNTSRLFVMGLATDYVVKNTLFDALHDNEEMPAGYLAHDPVPQFDTVVLVDAASRSIIAVNGDAVKDRVKQSNRGAVLYEKTVAGALHELCAGTCDLHSDCNEQEYCSQTLNHGFYSCHECKRCSQHGNDSITGKCPDYCKPRPSNVLQIVLATTIVLGTILLIGLLFYIYVDRQRGYAEKMRDHCAAVPCCFLSHHKASAGAKARLVKMLLQDQNQKHMDIFLDSDNLLELDDIRDHIRSSKVVFVFLTDTFLYRPYCLCELFHATRAGIKIELLHVRSLATGASIDSDGTGQVRELDLEVVPDEATYERKLKPMLRTKFYRDVFTAHNIKERDIYEMRRSLLSKELNVVDFSARDLAAAGQTLSSLMNGIVGSFSTSTRRVRVSDCVQRTDDAGPGPAHAAATERQNASINTSVHVHADMHADWPASSVRPHAPLVPAPYTSGSGSGSGSALEPVSVLEALAVTVWTQPREIFVLQSTDTSDGEICAEAASIVGMLVKQQLQSKVDVTYRDQYERGSGSGSTQRPIALPMRDPEGKGKGENQHHTHTTLVLLSRKFVSDFDAMLWLVRLHRAGSKLVPLLIKTPDPNDAFSFPGESFYHEQLPLLYDGSLLEWASQELDMPDCLQEISETFQILLKSIALEIDPNSNGISQRAVIKEILSRSYGSSIKQRVKKLASLHPSEDSSRSLV